MEHIEAAGAIKKGWEPTPPSTPRQQTPRRGGRPVLPALQAPPALRTNEVPEAVDARDILPAGVDVGLGNIVAMLAAEDWSERVGHSATYESKLLSCGSRLRRLERLTNQLRPPNVVVTAIACDLLRDTLRTLPPKLQDLVTVLLKHVWGAIYSDQETRGEDIDQLRRFVGHHVDKMPYFQIVRRQQKVLAREEKHGIDMRNQVDESLIKRKKVINFIDALQLDEAFILQQWLFKFWVITFQQRRAKIEAMASKIMDSEFDIASPFMAWRLFVSTRRLEKCRDHCQMVDIEASQFANRITEVERECEQQQGVLHGRLQESGALKEKVNEEQAEHHRLQKLWEATQPELLLSVLAQSLELFFGLVAREANFTSLEARHRLRHLDVSPMTEDLANLEDMTTLATCEVESLLVSWVNLALDKVRVWAKEQIQFEDDWHDEELLRLDMVINQVPITNLGEDLYESTPLCALFVVLRAVRDKTEMTPEDLWPLDERDFEIRASNICALLPTFAPLNRTRFSLTATDIVNCNVQLTKVFLASAFLEEPLLEEIPDDVLDRPNEWEENLEAVMCKMEECCMGVGTIDYLDDPGPLMNSGEDYQALATVSAEQLLLRWVNAQLAGVYHQPVENFGSDLQDGIVISLLLNKVAPEVHPEPEDASSNIDDRLEHITIDAARCTGFELLTVNALVEGHSDIIASFLAQLFLMRPGLAARPSSLLAMHVRVLRETCSTGYTTLKQLTNDTEHEDMCTIMDMCAPLEQRWQEITTAIEAVHDANTTLEDVRTRMRSFLGDTLAHRAQGHPRTMLDAKEARELLFYTAVNLERLTALLSKDAAINGDSVNRVEDLLKKHFRLLRDIYKQYATTVNTSTGITMEGILRFYNDCKLRSKELAPFHLESIFSEQMDMNKTTEQLLSPQNFIEVLIQIANMKYGQSVDQLQGQLLFLIENNLRNCRGNDSNGSIFQQMAYDPKVREVLNQHSEELTLVFGVYAEADQSTAEASQRANTMNIKEFQMLLVHCQMLDNLLTVSEVNLIFEGIQQGATDSHGHEQGGDGHHEGPQDADEAGVDDDDELAFSEFLDGLVAITAYKVPNPFTPFEIRVDAFIMELFGELRRYWSRKRGNPQVDGLLNALQKKLRVDAKDKKETAKDQQPQVQQQPSMRKTLSTESPRKGTLMTASGSLRSASPRQSNRSPSNINQSPSNLGAVIDEGG